MKIISRDKLPALWSIVFGIMVLAVSSASVPSGEIPISTQTGARLNPNPLLVSPSLPAVGPLFERNADILTRIAFATGTTSAVVNGSLSSSAVQSYILDAAWNQVMMVTVDSPGDNVYLEIYGQQDGTYLAYFSSNLTSWKGWLPRTESYIVRVFNSGGSATNYSLSVEIPARIQFARGAYSGSVYGRGSAAQIISYVLYARGGQTMTATLYSWTGSVYLSIQGFSGGQTLVSSSSGYTTWTGTLPQTQEYIVKAVQGGSWVDFTLTVTIV
jgi:hypothetical protein